MLLQSRSMEPDTNNITNEYQDSLQDMRSSLGAEDRCHPERDLFNTAPGLLLSISVHDQSEAK